VKRHNDIKPKQYCILFNHSNKEEDICIDDTEWRRFWESTVGSIVVVTWPHIASVNMKLAKGYRTRN